MNTAENKQQLVGQYWEILKESGIPNYLYLGDELVIITHLEKRKRKNGKTIDQVYFHTEDGLVKHATYFRKLSEPEIHMMKREIKINKILNNI